MPAAAMIVKVIPKNRSAVMPAKKPPIQFRKPTCGLNSSALIPIEATPIKMKARMNRAVRKFCIQSSSAWWPRPPENLDRGAAVDRLHMCRGMERHEQALGIAIGGERVDAAAFGQRIGDGDPLRLVRHTERRRLIFAGAEDHRAASRVTRRRDRDEAHRKAALAGIEPRRLLGLGVECREPLRHVVLRQRRHDRNIRLAARAQEPAAGRAHEQCSRHQRCENGSGPSGMTNRIAAKAAADKPALFLTTLIGHSARILELSAGPWRLAIYTMLSC